MQLCANPEVADRDAWCASCGRGGFLGAAHSGAGLLNLRTQHQLDDFLLDTRRDVDDPDRLAVAQDRSSVAQRGDFQKTVGNENDRTARLALPAHDVEHPLGQIGGQRGRHFIKQKDVRLDGERSRQVKYAQDGERDVPYGLSLVQIGHAKFANPGHKGLERRLRQPEIRQNVEVRDQRGLLVDRNQTGAPRFGGRADPAGLVTNEDLACIRFDGASQNFDQSRFAGAIRAHQGVDFTRQDGERRVFERGNGPVVFHHARSVKEELCRQCDHASQQE